MGDRSSCSDILLIIVAIFLPFVAVGIRRGFCTADFAINVALCLLGFFPGLIHAFYILAKYPSRSAGAGERQPLTA